MQIDQATVAATAAPSELQMNSPNTEGIVGGVTNVDEMQVDPGAIVVHATPTAPSGLQVKDLRSEFLINNC
jgi:hypothetical protein